MQQQRTFSESEALHPSNGCNIYPINIWEKHAFFESTFTVAGDVTADRITANYNLYVLGNLEVKEIIVRQNLVCLGDIKAETVLVQGNCNCLGKLRCDDLTVKGTLVAKDFIIHSGLVEKNLNLMRAGTISGTLSVKQNVLVHEGLSGSGLLVAQRILVNEYCDVKTEGLLSVLSESKAETPGQKGLPDFNVSMLSDRSQLQLYSEALNRVDSQFKDSMEQYLSSLEEKYTFLQIANKLKNLSRHFKKARRFNHCFKEVLRYSEKAKVLTVEEYIGLVLLKRDTPSALFSISIVNDLLTTFYDKDHEITLLSVESSSPSDLVLYLADLEDIKDIVGTQAYTILHKKLIQQLTRVEEYNE